MIYALYPIALSRGVSQDDFWDASVPELLDRFKAIDGEERRKLKEKVTLIFMQAEAVSTRIAFLFGDSKKRKKSDILQPWNVYPDLFGEEKDLMEQAEEADNLAKQKAAMEYYANSRKGLSDGR